MLQHDRPFQMFSQLIDIFDSLFMGGRMARNSVAARAQQEAALLGYLGHIRGDGFRLELGRVGHSAA